MKVFKTFSRFAFVSVSTLSLAVSAFASGEFGPDYDHRPAVGRIIAGNCQGTATLVDDLILASAAHVFGELIPINPKLPEKGPLLIDLKGRSVTWQYQTHSKKPPINIPVLSMVIDTAYIHAKHGAKPQSELAEKNDIVFLRLDPSQKPAGIPTMPLVGRVGQLSLMCAAIGFGGSGKEFQPRPTARPEYGEVKRSTEGRTYLIHKCDEIQTMAERDTIILNNHHNYPEGYDTNQAAREIVHLLHKPAVNIAQIYTNAPLQAIPGYSGGPLFIATVEGVRVIGITCGYSKTEPKNVFASLIAGSRRHGYRLARHVIDMLAAIGTPYVQPQKAPKVPKNTPKESGGIPTEPTPKKPEPKPAEPAPKGSGPKPTEPGPKKSEPKKPTEPAPKPQQKFNSQCYLKKYPHVRDEAMAYRVDPDIYAEQHYAKYKPLYPDLSDAPLPETTPRSKFNAKRYLEKYPHVKVEADKIGADEKEYALQHYNKYKAVFPNLSDK